MSLDITGERYSRLIAIRYVGICNGHNFWLFRCDLGWQKLHRNRVGPRLRVAAPHGRSGEDISLTLRTYNTAIKTRTKAHRRLRHCRPV
jgi:hypothetical protein